MDARQQSRKQVEYLMLKKPPIGNEQGDDTTEEPSEYHISKQKKSFDYSNYVNNKRLQLNKQQQTQLKARTITESQQYETQKKSKQQQLQAKAEKNKAIRKARRRMKQSSKGNAKPDRKEEKIQ
ncbi:uncharacterized protein KQ657_004552 [Scheffersomyces spartinae]|uniref:Uncharacterized protein n=1 Tax=Scheffersomyces spartinae TaxID=45513 RepID=A0A9P8AJ37_9ASCO|nr:uncharacterized protein KQ657_004552 [Scheffersomyces spartinae]KAG7194340.1 hypothetical protein KQ657_004552 [Scheffersomyces spartinae]